MESAFQKIGLYEIVGVLLTGMTSILIGMYLGVPAIHTGSIDNDLLKALLFVVASYFVGIVLQEISAWIDGKLFKFQDDYKSNFLNEKVWTNLLELQDFQEIAYTILLEHHKVTGFGKTNIPAKAQLYVFFYCKDYLEVRGKDWKATTVESLSDMSRGLMIAFPCLILYLIIRPLLTSKGIDAKTILQVIVLVWLTILSYRRAKKYALLRIRAIFRHYKMLSLIDN